MNIILSVCASFHNNIRSVLWNRQLDGALNRVPPDFYEGVWQILEHTPDGLKVATYHLKQVGGNKWINFIC